MESTTEIKNTSKETDIADLALSGVAVIEPLEEAVLVDELDAAAASARVSERVVDVPGIPTDPTNVLLFIVVVLARNAVNLLFR